jgi:hypothetical protein
MTELQKAAFDYAGRLIEYHLAKQDQSPESDTLQRKAYNSLCDAQNRINDLAEMQARALQ